MSRADIDKLYPRRVEVSTLPPFMLERIAQAMAAHERKLLARGARFWRIGAGS
jgi:hypothetical protein